MNKKDYIITLDQDFETVIHACAMERKGQRGTWLSPEMIAAYIRLHHDGWAHSAEVWRDGRLVGGIYGLALGRIFFGESMFSRAPNGSKLALVWLARQLAAWGFEWLDGQVGSPHLYTLGAIDLPRADFLRELNLALVHPDKRGPWKLEFDVSAGND